MGLSAYRPWGQSQDKIRAEHRDRAAVVYVRQSTRQQVVEHSESTRLQYALVERAVTLGWARSKVMVIDDDLGVSAARADTRAGFAKLVTEVTMGRVGMVLGMEMSRLARTGRDWHQLVELCSLSGALLADPDGVYDPRIYNDRLLLGLKGTMSEAELYLIRQRMLAGKLAKAERGELSFQLPIGYVRRSSGEAVFDPDEQAQHVVRLIFSSFARLGTLHAVLRHLVDNRIQLPVRARSGPAKGELEWRRPNRETLQIMLHNPIYAGYYAYGRRQVEHARQQPGRPATGRVVKASGEWLVLLPDRMPAYISVEQFEANLARLAANRHTAQTPGAPRSGSALLSGLLCCGRCGGHRMNVSYHPVSGSQQATHTYGCAYNQINYGAVESCQFIGGPALDAYITAQVLTAVAPAALEVSLRAAEQAEDERAELDKLWLQRIERATYTAERVRRQYQLAEPENRLVVRQLERDWEAALAQLDQLSNDYQRFRDTQPLRLTATERQAINALAEELPALWHAPTTTQAERKELLRLMIEQIEVNVAGDSELVDVSIAWAGGHHTHGQAVRPVRRAEQLSYFPRMIARVTELAARGMSCPRIADALNSEGFRPAKRSHRFTAQQVQRLIAKHGIRQTDPRSNAAIAADLSPDEWTPSDLATELGMPTATLHSWIIRGWITARRARNNRHQIITADAAELDRLRQLRVRPPGYYQRRRWLDAAAATDPEISRKDPP
ncbi:recombinase family protein [Nonomuraea sp. K274]|uniref:Recombinase family protein n=1 Tax=Nonomuraea cypriaca TaxID=1187855 RepID=A0A931AF34_9ACTN|nr:recombinase family protein [Nonomuraea cypriaca]